MALLGLTAADFRGTLLLRDCLEAQGAFLLVQLIKAALNEAGDGAMGLVPPPAARRVVLVAAQHAASHYAIVLRKAGLHVPDLLARGRLVVLDLLSMLGTGLLPLQVLHQQLAAAVAGGGVAGSGTGRGVCLVADDLSALHCLARGEEDWAAFLHACTSLGQGPQCCFIGLAHADVEADEGWLARLEHCAALVLDTEPLEPGRPASNTGRLAITRREVSTGGGAASSSTGAVATPGCHVLGYRLSEAGPAFLNHEQHSHPHIL
ncbi:hypothetical protein D9Q98_003071 [Chlorella vulgaris]|uniref:Elongator complex protein 6 n=1 Tax=Chlorella vulgaris TaxID=3077 RepID=A0A9D4TUH2_CHLVU|nr:hypothetical protein D9Q98_003071 [Chlorella vulgaris]